MVDQCPFLFEALARFDNNAFPFHQHLKAACNLLLPPTRAYILPLKQFIRQKMVRFQDSISKRLHHYTLSNMLSNKIYEIHHA
jgi:hypothetical protein